MATKEQIINGLAMFVERELIPSLHTKAEKFLCVTASTYMLSNNGKIGKLLDNNMLTLVGIKEDDEYDVDGIIIALKEGMNKCGGNVEFKGFKFNENDINNLKNYIEGA